MLLNVVVVVAIAAVILVSVRRAWEAWEAFGHPCIDQAGQRMDPGAGTHVAHATAGQNHLAKSTYSRGRGDYR